MKILVADETNNDPEKDIKFFIYGGVIFDTDAVKNIGDKINEIRESYNIQCNEKIKFNLKSCPEKLTRAEHTEIKNQIIDLAIENNVELLVNFVLHDIAKNQEKHVLHEMTSSTVFRRFNDFCNINKTPGLVLLDRWACDNGYSFLESCHLEGINYSDGSNMQLPWIYGYAQASDNSTALMSVADILLGALRYCINYRDKTEVNTLLMPKIASLFWHTINANGERDIWNMGLSTSPRKVAVRKYKDEYDSLCKHIVEYANKKA